MPQNFSISKSNQVWELSQNLLEIDYKFGKFAISVNSIQCHVIHDLLYKNVSFPKLKSNFYREQGGEEGGKKGNLNVDGSQATLHPDNNAVKFSLILFVFEFLYIFSVKIVHTNYCLKNFVKLFKVEMYV